MKTVGAALVALLLVACGGGSITDNGGIYQITAWTDNPDNCDAEGPSIAENQSETHFYIKDEAFFGEHFVTYNDCVELSDCEADYNDDDTIHLSDIGFDGGNDDDGLTGLGGFLVGDECSGTVKELLMTFDEAGNARLEMRSKMVENVPKDSDDFCDWDAAKEQAATKPCVALEVITGSPI
jgi:hypothetical protein